MHLHDYPPVIGCGPRVLIQMKPDGPSMVAAPPPKQHSDVPDGNENDPCKIAPLRRSTALGCRRPQKDCRPVARALQMIRARVLP